jgi:hypothetical protein
MQRLPAALTNNPTALWPSLIRTRKNVGLCPSFISDMTPQPFWLHFPVAQRRRRQFITIPDVTSDGLLAQRVRPYTYCKGDSRLRLVRSFHRKRVKQADTGAALSRLRGILSLHARMYIAVVQRRTLWRVQSHRLASDTVPPQSGRRAVRITAQQLASC